MEGDLSAMAIEHSLKPSMGNFVNSAFQTRTNDANIEMGVLVSGRAESNEINAAGTVQHSFSRFEPQRFTETADESTRLQQRSYYQQL